MAVSTLANETRICDSTVSAAERTRVFHTLDALRGIAAIAVVIYHFPRFFSPVAMPGGYLAVDLFFLLSGVVLARAYENRLYAGLTTSAFMRLRLIRLYPLYLLGLGLGLGAVVAGFLRHNTSQWDIPGLFVGTGLGLVFLPDPLPNPSTAIFPLDPPSWSLFFELLVNLLYAALIPFLSDRRLQVICGLCAAIVALTIFALGNINVGYNLHIFVYAIPRTIFGFSLGVLIARKLTSDPVEDTGAWRAALILAVTFIALAARPTGELRALWDAVCLFVLFPISVYFGVRVNPPRSWKAVVTFLGVTSYAIYALHAPLLGPAEGFLLGAHGGGVPKFGALTGVVVLGLLLLGAWLADQYYDAPLRRLLGRKAR